METDVVKNHSEVRREHELELRYTWLLLLSFEQKNLAKIKEMKNLSSMKLYSENKIMRHFELVS